MDCERFNSIATNVFETVANSLCTLDLTISKYTKNRRGLPGPATLSWVPPLPHLTSLDLKITWEIADWELSRWAPNVVSLRAIGDTMNCAGLGEENALMPSLTSLTLIGAIEDIDFALLRLFTTTLRSLSLNYPSNGAGRVVPMIYAPLLKDVLKFLTSLTSLALNIGSLEMSEESYSSDEDGAEEMISIEGRMTNLLRALRHLTGLKELKLAAFSQLPDEQGTYKKFMNLKQLEKVHILGKVPGFLTAADMAGTFPNLKECLLFGSKGERAPLGTFSSIIECAVLDYDAAFRSLQGVPLGTSAANSFSHGAISLNQLTLLRSGSNYWRSMPEDSVTTRAIAWLDEVLDTIRGANRDEASLTVYLGNDGVGQRVKASLNELHPRVRVEAVTSECIADIVTWERWEREFLQTNQPPPLF